MLRDGPVRLEALEDGAIWRAVLNTPKANILDMEKCDILSGSSPMQPLQGPEGGGHRGTAPTSPSEPASRSTSLTRSKPCCTASTNSSTRILDARVVTLAAVRGQCLGGAMELAIFCNRLFASPDAGPGPTGDHPGRHRPRGVGHAAGPGGAKPGREPPAYRGVHEGR